MSDAEPNETELVERAIDGDDDAYDALVSIHIRRVVRIAWSIVRNAADAEDLAQDAFVRGYEKLGSFRRGAAFGPWIHRIVSNLALDLLKHRKRIRHEEISESEPAARRDQADLPTRSNEIAARIEAAIDELPEMQRIVTRLHYVDEFEHAEIAAMTGLAEGTVRSHLSLGRKKLKERLADLYGGSDE